ncbi:MAG: 30S ribosomal protein S4 [Methanophagales archaeon]|nr:30S ribosomal protein S4 [Methanophagales archaeon]
MGHPKRRGKRYEKPRRPWEMKRIKEEKELTEMYGLKNKREIWKAASIIIKYRREIRAILAEIAGMKPTEHTLRKQEAILAALRRRGILKETSLRLEDVLALRIDDILERRLQTRVYKKGLSNSLKHARQLIVHGHIAVNGRRVTIPSYIIDIEEEGKIGYYEKGEF